MGVNFKPHIRAVDGVVLDNFVEAFDFGAVLAAIGPIAATAGRINQPLAVQAETVIGIVIDAAVSAVLRISSRASGDGGQPAQRPADTFKSVSTLARISKR